MKLEILLEFRSDIDAFDRINAVRIRFFEMISSNAKYEDATQISFEKYGLAFASLKLSMGKSKDLGIAKIDIE